MIQVEGGVVHHSRWIQHGTNVYLNETRGKVYMSKHLFDGFPIQKGLKQGDILSSLLFNFV
jgi:hypothetical protein